MKSVAATAIVLSLMSASVAMAKDHRDSHPESSRWSSQHHDARGHDDPRASQRDWQRSEHDYRRGSDRRFHGPAYHRPHGYRDYRWSRGQYLPRAYYARPYWVSNYGYYRLRPPPRGCHWVRINNDVVLTALVSGVVLDVMYDYFW